jgi:hypothetical protein
MAFSRHAATLTVAALVLASASAAADVTKEQCIDANTQGQELRRSGKLADARQKLSTCADPACPAIVQGDCTRRLDDLEKAQPTIVFSAKGPGGADLTAVKVTVDGKPLVDKLDGNVVSVDPGQHSFVFTTAGRPPVTRSLLIVEGEKGRREAVDMTGGAGAALPTGPTTGGPAPQGPQSAPAGDGGGMGTQKILALVAGGIGVVGIGVGSAFGFIAISKKSDAQSACPNQCATSDGVTKWSDAGAAGNLSTIGFIVGGVGLAGAAVLWFMAPSSGASTAQVGIGPGALQLKGTW